MLWRGKIYKLVLVATTHVSDGGVEIVKLIRKMPGRVYEKAFLLVTLFCTRKLSNDKKNGKGCEIHSWIVSFDR